MHSDQDFFRKLRQPLPDNDTYISKVNLHTTKLSKVILLLPIILSIFTVIAFISPFGIKSWFEHNIFLEKNKGQDKIFNNLNLTEKPFTGYHSLKNSSSLEYFITKLNEIDKHLIEKNYAKADMKLRQLKLYIDSNNFNINLIEDHDVILRWNDILSEMSFYTGDLAKAMEFANNSLEYSIKNFGKNSKQTAKRYELISYFYSQNGDIKNSLSFQHNALIIYSNIKSFDQGTLLVKMNNMGEKYRLHGDYPNANKIISGTISFIERKYGTSAPELAIPLNNLALLKMSKGERTKAEAYLLRAYEISIKYQGRDHHVTKDIGKNLYKLRKDMT